MRKWQITRTGSVLGRGSSVDNDVVIGRGVRIQTNCYITADSVIEDEAFLAPGVVTTNDNTMGRLAKGEKLNGVSIRRRCRIGGGVIICPGVEIGQDAYVAAGAVVARDVPSGTRWMDVPAREVG